MARESLQFVPPKSRFIARGRTLADDGGKRLVAVAPSSKASPQADLGMEIASRTTPGAIELFVREPDFTVERDTLSRRCRVIQRQDVS